MTDIDRSTTRTDVAIIGAGVSGLRTALRLQRLGASVQVLEARDRIGGRLLSPAIGEPPTDDSDAAGIVDLGATWFWPNEPRVMELIAESGLAIFPQHMAGDMMFQNGAVQRMSGNQLDVPSGRVAEGMAAITSVLESELAPGTVQLGRPVTAVHSTGDSVRLHADGLVVDASHAVVALPPALAVASIDFGDGLSDELRSVAASTPVWMGSTVKVVAVFEQPFWRARGLAGSAFSYDGPMREIHDMSGPHGSPAALFGFCAIPPSETAPTEADVISQFVDLFGVEAAGPIAVWIMDWRREPLTTPPDALGLADYSTYGHAAYQSPAMDGRLHWVSTETSTEAPGHVEGALAAADRAVGAIAAATGDKTTIRGHDTREAGTPT